MCFHLRLNIYVWALQKQFISWNTRAIEGNEKKVANGMSGLSSCPTKKSTQFQEG